MDNNFENQNQFNNTGVNYNDTGNAVWLIVGLFFPIIGLVLFIIWKDTNPNNSKKAGIGALIGFICHILLPIIIFVLFLMFNVSNISSTIDCLSKGENYEAIQDENGWYCKNNLTGEIIKSDGSIECKNGDCYNLEEDDDEAFDKCVKLNNGMHAVDYDEKRFVYDFKIDSYAKLIKAVDYKTVNDSTDPFDYELWVLSEGVKYDSGDEYITISNGVVTMHTKGKDYKSNVKNAKYLYIENNGEYDHSFAILTSDGDLYFGDELLDIDSEYDYFNSKAFNSLKKVNSKSKYKDLNLVLFDYKCHEKYYDADSYPYEFVGITTDGKMDLLD